MSVDIETVEWGRGGDETSSCSGGDICRICHCESDPHNPLLAPCQCAGSLKYVHQACLQQWLRASETRSCELCKFQFLVRCKMLPVGEWRGLDMSGVERRRLCCAVLFHAVAALCVMWSLFVLIERAAEEIHKGHIAWPFWTKLVVVAVGFTGGAVFMYIQCRQYLALCSRWRCHNRILLIQNAPNLHAANNALNVLSNPPQPNHPTPDDDDSGGFDEYRPNSFRRILHSPNQQQQQHHQQVYHISHHRHLYDDPLELNIREMLELDGKSCSGKSLDQPPPLCHRQPFKSLPNLSASSESLLPLPLPPTK